MDSALLSLLMLKPCFLLSLAYSSLEFDLVIALVPFGHLA